MQSEVDAIRIKLRISSPDSVSYWAETGNCDVIVKADGFGGAMTLIVEGNYPIDFFLQWMRNISRKKKRL